MAIASAAITSSGALVAADCKVLAVHYRAAGTAGTVILKDGGSGGTAKLTINTPAAVGAHTLLIPGGGIVFATNCYGALTTADAVTIIYDDLS